MRRCCLLRESIDTGCVNPLAARVRVRVYVCIGRTCVQPQSRVWRPLLACLVFLVFLVACAATARHGVVLPPQLAEKLILARSNQRSKCLHLPDNNNNNSNGAAYPPLDQQLPSLKSQQTPRSLKVASSSPLAEPKHFQANLCSFPTNVDNSQHFHFIMAQRTLQVAKGYAGRLPGPQLVRASLGAHFKILLCKSYYFYMINRKIPTLDKAPKYKPESPIEETQSGQENPYPLGS